MRIAVTGADGLIGRHARVLLRARGHQDVVTIRRGELDDPLALAERLRGCDAVWHFAGVNRADDRSLEEGNVALARALDAALSRGTNRARVLYASSTQSERDTPYGRGKRIAGELLAKGARARGADFTEFVLPHVFGEGARPHYNTVVATFIHHLAAGTSPEIHPEGRVELMHAGWVAERFLQSTEAGASVRLRPEGVTLSVAALWERLEGLAARYRAGILPLLADPLDRTLFNSYRFTLFPIGLVHTNQVHADDRGELIEVIRHSGQGQVFVSATRPGKVRGRHWHRYKVERFCVVSGEGVVRLRPILGTAVTEVRLAAGGPQILDIPTLHVHEVENVGRGDLVMAFWADEHYDPAAADTYPDTVLPT